MISLRSSAGRPIWSAALAACVALAGCVVPEAGPAPAPLTAPAPVGAPIRGQAAFLDVASRVEPVAEAMCRKRGLLRLCDFAITVDSRPGAPPNAYQTLDKSGRPVLVFTQALIAGARNADELAFVIGHEAGHHVADHIPKRQDEAMTGAILAGVIAGASGLSVDEVKAAQNIGAEIGARRFSKEFELEADALGTEIALMAGFDPVRGAAYFDRLPDPGDQFLGTHPPNAQRKAVVMATVKRLRGS